MAKIYSAPRLNAVSRDRKSASVRRADVPTSLTRFDPDKKKSALLHLRGGLMLARSTPERALRVRSLRGHCVVFLGKTLYSHGASLHPGV